MVTICVGTLGAQTTPFFTGTIIFSLSSLVFSQSTVHFSDYTDNTIVEEPIVIGTDDFSFYGTLKLKSSPCLSYIFTNDIWGNPSQQLRLLISTGEPYFLFLGFGVDFISSNNVVSEPIDGNGYSTRLRSAIPLPLNKDVIFAFQRESQKLRLYVWIIGNQLPSVTTYTVPNVIDQAPGSGVIRVGSDSRGTSRFCGTIRNSTYTPTASISIFEIRSLLGYRSASGSSNGSSTDEKRDNIAPKVCPIPTSGSATITSDCFLYSQIVVTGKLNVTGIPDARGNLPKLIGGGSNRLFKVESGGELVVRSLNLTGGVADGIAGAGKGGGIFTTNGNVGRNTGDGDNIMKHL